MARHNIDPSACPVLRIATCDVTNSQLLWATQPVAVKTGSRNEHPERGPQRDKEESEKRIGKDGLANPRLPTCRFYRYNYSRGEHYEYDLEEGEKHFVVLVTPTDPSSFVDVSSVTSPARRLPPPSPSSVVSSPWLEGQE